MRAGGTCYNTVNDLPTDVPVASTEAFQQEHALMFKRWKLPSLPRKRPGTLLPAPWEQLSWKRTPRNIHLSKASSKASVEAFADALVEVVEVASMEAFTEAYTEASVEVACVEAYVEVVSVEASVETSMEAASTRTLLPYGSFRGNNSASVVVSQLPRKFSWQLSRKLARKLNSIEASVELKLKASMKEN